MLSAAMGGPLCLSALTADGDQQSEERSPGTARSETSLNLANWKIDPLCPWRGPLLEHALTPD